MLGYFYHLDYWCSHWGVDKFTQSWTSISLSKTAVALAHGRWDVHGRILGASENISVRKPESLTAGTAVLSTSALTQRMAYSEGFGCGVVGGGSERSASCRVRVVPHQQVTKSPLLVISGVTRRLTVCTDAHRVQLLITTRGGCNIYKFTFML